MLLLGDGILGVWQYDTLSPRAVPSRGKSTHEDFDWCFERLFRFFGPRERNKSRGGDLDSNAFIGIEFYEFRQKLKNLEFRENSSFW